VNQPDTAGYGNSGVTEAWLIYCSIAVLYERAFNALKNSLIDAVKLHTVELMVGVEVYVRLLDRGVI